MDEVKITYRGWPGHFCAASRCDFRLNTFVEYKDIKIVVSTVGLYRNSNDEIDEIGYNRYYETMCFHAAPVDNHGFIDANVKRDITHLINTNWAYGNIEDEWLANKGHIATVAEVAERLKNGERFELDIDKEQ